LFKARKETDLFENFTLLTKTPPKELEYNSSLIELLTMAVEREALSKGKPPTPVSPAAVVGLCKAFSDGSFHAPLSNSDIGKLLASKDKDAGGKALELLRRIGRLQVLDISEEISLLREIKDIQDELGIMSMLFEDQRRVLATFDAIIESMTEIELRPRAMLPQMKASETQESTENITFGGLETNPVAAGTKKEEDVEDGVIQVKQAETTGELMTHMQNLLDDGERARGEMLLSNPPDAPQLTNHANDAKHTVSPRAIVQLSIDEITRMAERATNVYKAVSNSPSLRAPCLTLSAQFPCGSEAETEQRHGCSVYQDPSGGVAQNVKGKRQAGEDAHGLHNCYHCFRKSLSGLATRQKPVTQPL
jgi:hypothetical protein